MMARSLSTILFKGLTRLPSTRLSAPVCGPFYQNGIKYSTTLSDDPDTHEDFRPASKLENPSLSVRDIVEQDVKENPVMIYMKGIPELPRCGFSSLAVRVLKEYNVPLSARNILEDPELKNAVKAFSNWPTFPQIFINGEFVGGSDIILSMHQNGELEEKLKDMVSSKGNSAS
ncbi:Monothiol glutaredoxin-S15, mitochondrial [Dionaea muscipula]